MTHDGRVTEPDRRSLLARLLTGPLDPHRPLDHDFVQHRWVRLHRPGPWRVATIIAAVATFALGASSLTTAALTVPGSALQRVVALAVGALLVSGVGIVVFRALAVGVYMTDTDVRVSTLRATVRVPWRDVRDVRRVPARVAVLGLPFLAGDGERVLLVLADGTDLPTPLTSLSPDFAGRTEAYDVAALRLERWWQAGRR